MFYFYSSDNKMIQETKADEMWFDFDRKCPRKWKESVEFKCESRISQSWSQKRFLPIQIKA